VWLARLCQTRSVDAEKKVRRKRPRLVAIECSHDAQDKDFLLPDRLRTQWLRTKRVGKKIW